jgi:hypothetical protein
LPQTHFGGEGLNTRMAELRGMDFRNTREDSNDDDYRTQKCVLCGNVTITKEWDCAFCLMCGHDFSCGEIEEEVVHNDNNQVEICEGCEHHYCNCPHCQDNWIPEMGDGNSWQRLNSRQNCGYYNSKDDFLKTVGPVWYCEVTGQTKYIGDEENPSFDFEWFCP